MKSTAEAAKQLNAQVDNLDLDNGVFRSKSDASQQLVTLIRGLMGNDQLLDLLIQLGVVDDH